MADPIKTPQQMAELVGQAQGQTTPPAVAPTPNPTAQPVPVNVAQPTTGFLDLGNGKVIKRNDPKYQALIASGYTDEKIVSELQKKQQKPATSGQYIQPTQSTPQTEPIAPVEKPIQEQNQVVQPNNLPDFQDNSQPRQEEIVNNLNRYYQSNPSMFQDRELFNQSFSYENRSDLQKSILDNWYKSNIDKVNEATALSRQLPGDVAKQYTDGKLQDTDLNALKLADPVKYAQVQEQIEKNRIMDKYKDLLYGEEETTQTPLDKITQQMTDMLKTKTSSNMYDEYQTELNSPDMKGLMDAMASQEGEIKQIDEQINATKSGLEAQFKGSGISQGRINALIQDQVQLLQNKRNSKALEYQTTADKYQNRMAVIKQNLEAKEKQFDMEQKQEQSTLNKLSFNYNIYADQQKRDDAKKASDLEFKRDLEKMNLQQEMAFNQAVKMDKLENGDINNADPYIVQKAVQKNVDQLMQQYDGLLTSTRDQLVTRVQDGLKSGKSYGQVQSEIMQDIQAKPEYSQWRNNKLGLDNKPVQIADGIYYQNGKMMSESQMRSMYNIPSKELEAINSQIRAERATGGYSQYDDPTKIGSIKSDPTLGLGVNCGVQCAGYTSLVYKKLTGQSMPFGSTLEDKVNTMNKIGYSPVPVVGGFVALDTKNGGYGHTGYVTEVSPDGKRVKVLNSNYSGTAKSPNNTVTENRFDIGSVKASSVAPGKTAPGVSGYKATPEAQKEITSLRKEFNALPEVKDYKNIRTFFNTIQSQAQQATPAGDLSLIFSYMKMLDPNSTVREGEFANAQNAGSIDDKTRNMYNKAIKGTRLSDGQRKDFVSSAEKQYRIYESTYNTKLRDYQSYITQGGDPSMLGEESMPAQQPQQNTNIFGNLSSGVGSIAQPSYLQGLSILGY